MSQNDTEQTARLLTGENSLLHENGSLEMVAAMYIMLLAANTDFEQEVRPLVGGRFDILLQERMRTMIPPLLDMLRNREVVHAISNYMHFIAISCPARGIPIHEITSMVELRWLWHNAHLRSALKEIASLDNELIGGQNPAIASAVLAGVTIEEMGIAQADADWAVDDYFGRNDPKRKGLWEAHKKDYDELKKLFAAP